MLQTEEAGSVLPTSAVEREEARRLRYDILRGIVTHLTRCQEQAEERGRHAYVDRFVSRLQESDTVICFTWDILLERRLRYANVAFQYHGHNAVSNVLTVLKPYGSIDWARPGDTRADGAAEHVWSSIHRTPFQTLVNGTALSEHGAEPVMTTEFTEAALSPPGLVEVWPEASRRLVEADQIHLCGVRLPTVGTYARHVLSVATGVNAERRTHGGLEPASVTLVDPAAEAGAEYRAILVRALTHYKDRFQNSRWTA
jgi:hypothetical protein